MEVVNIAAMGEGGVVTTAESDGGVMIVDEADRDDRREIK